MAIQNLSALRPLSLGELLDRAIRLYRRNFLTFIGIVALIHVPVTVLQTASVVLMNSGLFSGSEPGDIFMRSTYAIGAVSTTILSAVQYVLVQGVAAGALTRAVADRYLGRQTGILEAYRRIRPVWLKLVGALALVWAGMMGLTMWTIVPCIGNLTGPGMLLFVTVVFTPLVPAAIVLEDQGVFDTVRRVWSLARRRFWPLLGSVFALYLFNLIVVNGPAGIVSVLLVWLSNTMVEDPGTYLALVSVTQGLTQLVFVLLYLPLQLTAFALIYLDLRVRTEGFDLALLTLETSDSTELSEAIAPPAVPSDERFITWPELGNFALLTVGGVMLYMAFVAFIIFIVALVVSLAVPGF